MANSEEEDFGEEVVIEGGDDDIEFDMDDAPIAVAAPPPKAEDGELQTLIARFNPKTGPARRLLYDLQEMNKSDPKVLGFSTEPCGNDIFSWQVKLFGFEKGSEMSKDLVKYKKSTGRDYVEVQVTFPPDYPNSPPFVRVVQPRFAFHTGRVTIGGSLCTDILTLESWNPMYDIQGLMVAVFSEIMNGNPRIDFGQPQPYSLQEAKQAYMRVAHDHGWRTSQWLPDR
jgi:ubiquitin-conjugating enzyme E2 Q